MKNKKQIKQKIAEPCCGSCVHSMYKVSMPFFWRKGFICLKEDMPTWKTDVCDDYEPWQSMKLCRNMICNESDVLKICNKFDDCKLPKNVRRLLNEKQKTN